MNSNALLYVKPIIQDPYFDIPTWLNSNIQRKEYVVLDGQTSSDDVQLFLITLMGYNNIDVSRDMDEVFQSLLDEQEVAISGGILFIGAEKKIFPSC